MLISFITSFRTIDKIQKLKTEFLEYPEKVIKKHKEIHLKVIELIDTRREHLFKVLAVILNILRFVMLAHALNFPLLKKCSKIFISVCGIVSTSLAIFNTLIGDPRN